MTEEGLGVTRPASRDSTIADRIWPGVIFLLALGLRLGLIFTTLDLAALQVGVGDALEYEKLADRILTGDLLAGNEVFFHSASGYPYLLAFLWAIFGKSMLVARLFQALAGAVNAVVVYAIARQLFGGENRAEQRRGRIVGRISGLLLAFYGYIAFLEHNLFMTAYELLAIDLALLVLLWFLSHRRWSHLAGAGVCFGLASLGRPNVWLIAIAVGVFLFLVAKRSWHWKTPKALVTGAVPLVLTFLLILPITIRNYRVAGDPVLLTCNAGINFYIGNHLGATGLFSVPHHLDANLFAGSRSDASVAEGRDLSAGEASAHWVRRTLGVLAGNPGHALSILGRKILLFFDGYEIPNNVGFYFTRSHGAWILWVMPIGFWLVMPLGLGGLVLWRSWDRRHWLILLYLVLYTAMIVGMFVTGRYRLPTIPLLVPFAAWMGYKLVGLVHRRDWRGLRPAALVLLPAAVLVNGGFMERRHPTDQWTGDQWAFVAAANQRLGKAAEAAAAFREAHAMDPDNPLYLNGLGNAARARGDYEEAERYLRRAYDLSRGDPQPASNLAGVLALMGRSEEAVEILEAALESHPDNLHCLTNLAFTHYAGRRPDLALEYSMRVIALGKAAPQTYNLIAFVLIDNQEFEEALGYIETGQRQFPQDQELWVTRAQIEMARGNPDAARQALDRAQRLPGRSPRIPPLRARLRQ